MVLSVWEGVWRGCSLGALLGDRNNLIVLHSSATFFVEQN